ncbi:hypothetical protein KBY25_21915 [Ruegeria pomeroyi]|nr:hypothetical protein [Ruegeria pomeroyi]
MSAPDRIEDQLNADRRRFANSLSCLSNSLAPGAVSQYLSATVQSYGGEMTNQVVKFARRNPAGLVLTGVGVALMAAELGRRQSPVSPPARTAVSPDAAFVGFDARVAAADATIKKEMTGMSTETYRASKMRETLNAGLDALPEGARKRVIAARQAALSAQEKIEAHAAEAAARSRSFYAQNPLAVGAIALGLGALIGAMLPATRREDEILGAHRDALAERAEAALRHEMEKVGRLAGKSLRDVGADPASASVPS